MFDEVRKIRAKYPHMVPIVLRTKLPLDKHKYLVPEKLTVAELMIVIRKRHNFTPNLGLFFLTTTGIPVGALPLHELYRRYQDPQSGFLYLQMVTENTFGSF